MNVLQVHKSNGDEAEPKKVSSSHKMSSSIVKSALTAW